MVNRVACGRLRVFFCAKGGNEAGGAPFFKKSRKALPGVPYFLYFRGRISVVVCV